MLCYRVPFPVQEVSVGVVEESRARKSMRPRPDHRRRTRAVVLEIRRRLPPPRLPAPAACAPAVKRILPPLPLRRVRRGVVDERAVGSQTAGGPTV